ncbi:type II toxin-antitoxin system PemK/MazF family toxin [Rhabdobacter roseus]|uniref:mRNA interferase MazF n=1 Tax=Rhabdobacter roseus TaxID=1655419 RepID=A0A840TNU1_9BACT|nr:mRNA interferase MazF [Rhabdobacter roseus]
MKKGDIVLIPFPFTDLTGQKKRPALVLVTTSTDITVAFITSQVKWQEEYDLKLDPNPENGLKKASLVRLSKIATLDHDLVIGRLGTLPARDTDLLNKKLIKLFKLDT